MILIVDDKPENLFSLRKLLELNKYAVDTADSGKIALKKILKTTYSLIILDVQMPDMDGFEVAEAIAGYTKTKDIPILFLSAVKIDKKFIAKGYSSGGIDYITKPFDPDILLLKVKTFVKLHEQNSKLMKAQETLHKEIETRKKAESALIHAFSQLQSVLETIPQIAFTLKRDGSIEYVNKHWLDYSSTYSTFPETQIGSLTIKQIVKKVISEKTHLSLGLEIKNITAMVFRHHLLSLTPVKKEDEIVKWVGILTDIHDQKIANILLEEKVLDRTRDLQALNKKLESSNHDLQQYASVASHDLKEPLRKIQVFSNLLADKYPDDTQQSYQYVKRILTSSSRMTNLIDDLLMHASLSAESEFSPTNLNEIITGILSDIEILIKEKNAIIEIGDLPAIDSIPGQMRQLFQNLISNAIKFSKESVTPHIRIHAEMINDLSISGLNKANGKYCRISVTDNGIGFPQQYNEKIFSIFKRLNAKDKFEGTGIGLAIVKKIIDKHHGLIEAYSSDGNGACFIIVLPLGQPEII